MQKDCRSASAMDPEVPGLEVEADLRLQYLGIEWLGEATTNRLTRLLL